MLQLIPVVVLHLMVWDADTGTLLEKAKPYIRAEHAFSVSGDKIEDCRKYGVEVAKRRVAEWRKTKPNAFANVDCQWERRVSGEPA